MEQAISSELADSPPWIWVNELVTICTSMIAMTRPVHIANTPIQSLSRGFSSGSLAGAKGGTKDGRSSALVVGAGAADHRGQGQFC